MVDTGKRARDQALMITTTVGTTMATMHTVRSPACVDSFKLASEDISVDGISEKINLTQY